MLFIVLLSTWIVVECVESRKGSCEPMGDILVEKKDIQKTRRDNRRWIEIERSSIESILLSTDEKLKPTPVNDFNAPEYALCKTPLESYGEGDEEKRACGLEKLFSSNATLLGSPCVVYSIGSNDQWAFELDIVRRTSCLVETFDCIVGPEVHPAPSIAHRVTLHRKCIFHEDKVVGNQTFLTWPSLLQHRGRSLAPTFLKLDVEGWEWKVLRHMILHSMAHNASHLLPGQVAVEMHMHRHRSHEEVTTFVAFMFHFGGYQVVHLRRNAFCRLCVEVLFVRSGCDSRVHARSSSKGNSAWVLRALDKFFAH